MTAATAITVILPEDDPSRLEAHLLSFAAFSEIHRRLELFYRAAQGACLTKLRGLHGHLKGGGDTSARCGGATWESYIKDKFGFSADTADRRMKIWQGMTPLLGRLSADELETLRSYLARMAVRLTGEEEQVIRAITQKITTAETEREFLTECGFIRQDRALPPAPTHKGGPRQPGDTSLIIQDELFGRLGQTGEMYEWWSKPVKIGRASVPVWQTMSDEQKAQMETRLEATARQLAAMLAELRETRRKK